MAVPGGDGGALWHADRLAACMSLFVDIFARADERGERAGSLSGGVGVDFWDFFGCTGRPPGLYLGLEDALGLGPGRFFGSVEAFFDAGEIRNLEALLEMRKEYSCTIVVTDLTVMREGRLCLAGVDIRSMRDVRPTRGGIGLSPRDLEVMGGRIRPGCALEFEPTEAGPEPRRPHLEDVPFDPSAARVLYRMGPAEVHDFLKDIARPRLRDIYGPRLHGNWAVPDELERSLGTLDCSRVLVRKNEWGRMRIDVWTRGGDAVADLPFNDYLVHDYLGSAADRAVFEKRLSEVNRALNHGGRPIARVGLSRPFDPHGKGCPRCWLQVNAVYPRGTL